MKNTLFRLLGIEPSELDLKRLTPHALEQIADDLEEAISNPKRVALDQLSGELYKLMELVLRSLPDESRTAIKSYPKDMSAHVQSYLSGQIAFAQHLASLASSKRVSDDFYKMFEEAWAKPYIKALYELKPSSSELATLVSSRPETTSRNLKKLRSVGIADFRRDGVSVINFLTQPAREVWASIVSEVPETLVDRMRSQCAADTDGTQNPQTVVAVKDLLASLMGKSPSHMKKLPIMDAPHE